MNAEERKHYNHTYSQDPEKKAARNARDRARKASITQLESLDTWFRAQQDRIRKSDEDFNPLFDGHWRPIDPLNTPEFYDFTHRR